MQHTLPATRQGPRLELKEHTNEGMVCYSTINRSWRIGQHQGLHTKENPLSFFSYSGSLSSALDQDGPGGSPERPKAAKLTFLSYWGHMRVKGVTVLFEIAQIDSPGSK